MTDPLADARRFLANCGDGAPQSLSPEQVRKVREFAAAGRTPKWIANYMRRSESAISRLLSGDRYKGVA